MKFGRYDHTMTKLPGGDVLIAGGNDGKRAMRHLEIYEVGKRRFHPRSQTHAHGAPAAHRHGAFRRRRPHPRRRGRKRERATRSFIHLLGRRTRLVRSLTTQRSRHTATRLKDGRVLIAGGLGRGKNAGHGAEIYHPATEKFIPLKGKLRVNRQQHTATLMPDGRVVLVGGWGGEGRTLGSAEVFEPEKGCFWLVGVEMKFPRRLHTATSLGGGRVLIAGGATDNEVLNSAEILTIPQATEKAGAELRGISIRIGSHTT